MTRKAPVRTSTLQNTWMLDLPSMMLRRAVPFVWRLLGEINSKGADRAMLIVPCQDCLTLFKLALRPVTSTITIPIIGISRHIQSHTHTHQLDVQYLVWSSKLDAVWSILFNLAGVAVSISIGAQRSWFSKIHVLLLWVKSTCKLSNNYLCSHDLYYFWAHSRCNPHICDLSHSICLQVNKHAWKFSVIQVFL